MRHYDLWEFFLNPRLSHGRLIVFSPSVRILLMEQEIWAIRLEREYNDIFLPHQFDPEKYNTLRTELEKISNTIDSI